MIMIKIDRDELEKLYIEENKGSKEIAKKFGVCQHTILERLRQYGIPLKKTGGQKGITRVKGRGCQFVNGNGYVEVYYPSHPSSNKKGYIKEHRLVMEEHLGRQLKEDEIVHHINHIRTDNRIENLQVMNNREHAKFHAKKQWEERKDGQGFY